MITADETHSNLMSLPHRHTISYHNNREARAFVPKIRNQNFGLCLRALKEMPDQNWPVKFKIPDFARNFWIP